MIPSFHDKLSARMATLAGRAGLCVGLDPLPDYIGANSKWVDWAKAIIDETAPYTSAYKPQIAHYSALSAEGALESTLVFLRKNYPDIPVILDAKRGDIGVTATRYAAEAFERYEADAVTVNPYMGTEVLAPFLAYKGRGVFSLVRTSGPSADSLQRLPLQDGRMLYEAVAEMVTGVGDEEALGMVVGALDLDALVRIQTRYPRRWLLIPGVGAQGGTLSDVLLHTKAERRLIVSARSILYPKSGTSGEAAKQMAEAIASRNKGIA